MYIAIAVLVIIVALSFYFYKKGKKTTSIQYLPGDLPYGNSGNGSNQTTGASNSEIKSIAQSMFADMDGFNIWGHDIEPYQRASTLSDTDFVKLYNTFNALYQTESGETLTQWLVNEKFYNNEVTDSLITRCAKLNLI